MDNNNSGKKLIIVIVIIIVLAVILAIWLSWRQSPASQTPEQLSFSEAQKANESASLDVPDQFPGNIVYVSRVDFPAGGFVVVRKVASSTPAQVLGVTFFDKDTRLGNVDLSEATVDGESYLAQGWTDDGDAQFNEVTDKIITNANGERLEIMFEATKNLPEKKG